MEISPIPGIRALRAVRAPSAGVRPPAIFDIDGSAKPGDGAGSRNSRKAAGVDEGEEDDLALDNAAEPDSDALEEVSPRSIDYFA